MNVVYMGKYQQGCMPDSYVKALVERFGLKPLDEQDTYYRKAVFKFIQDNRFNHELIDFVQRRSATGICGSWLKVLSIGKSDFAIIRVRSVNEQGAELEEEEIICVPDFNAVDYDILCCFVETHNKRAVLEYLSRCGTNVCDVEGNPEMPVEWHKLEEAAC